VSPLSLSISLSPEPEPEPYPEALPSPSSPCLTSSTPPRPVPFYEQLRDKTATCNGVFSQYYPMLLSSACLCGAVGALMIALVCVACGLLCSFQVQVRLFSSCACVRAVGCDLSLPASSRPQQRAR